MKNKPKPRKSKSLAMPPGLIIPPYRVSVEGPETPNRGGFNQTSYGDGVVTARGETKHQLVEKLRNLAEFIANSDDAYNGGQVFLLRRKH